jgi:hypothetical protein
MDHVERQGQMSDIEQRLEDHNRELLLTPVFDGTIDVLWERSLIIGKLLTNVQMVVAHHSLTGEGVGYEGGGAADFALNILNVLYPGDDVRCFYGFVSQEAWSLHQDFVREFIASADSREGRIAIADIRSWLEEVKSRGLKEPLDADSPGGEKSV